MANQECSGDPIFNDSKRLDFHGNAKGDYGKGMGLRDISEHIKEMYDVEISATTLSAITDRVIPQVEEWQNRPLESLYTIVWLYAMHYKVRD